MTILKLLSPSSLSVFDDANTDASAATVFDLNTLLGNDNGSFDCGGVWLTASARNVTLKGRLLCAELQDLNQDWNYNEIAILPLKSPSKADGQYELSFDKSAFGLEQAWSDHLPTTGHAAPTLDGCRNIRLRQPSTVVALCRIAPNDDLDVHVEYRRRRIDLNPLLGSKMGRFNEHGKNFAKKARNVRIVGSRLIAELWMPRRQQWREDAIDLFRLIVCKQGRLQSIREKEEAVKTTEAPQRTKDGFAMLVKKVSGLSACLYAPLSESEHAIRLCYILPGNWQDKLECYMVTEAIGSSEYRCLSYCWGAADVTECVNINGHDVFVRRNLACAVRRLRARNMSSAVWIDAICINQQDSAEKSSQVSRMAEIFSNALEVLIWLDGGQTTASMGSSDSTSELDSGNVLIDALEYLAKGFIHKSFFPLMSVRFRPDGTLEYGGYSDRLVRAIESFLESEWFTRAWTIQELILTDRAVFMFGQGTIRWETLEDAHKVVDHYFRERSRQPGLEEEKVHGTPDLRSKPLNRVLRRLVKILWPFRNMKRDYKDSRRLGDDQIVCPRDTAVLLIHKCRPQKSSDARDKLFAFYDIAQATFGSLYPDYSLEIVDVYMSFTLANILETRCFDIWALKDAELEEQARSGLPALPSWAIDWSRPVTESLQPGLRYRFKFDQTQSRITQQYSEPIARLTCQSMLLVSGYEVDEIREVTTTVYTSFSPVTQAQWDQASWEEHGHVLRDWNQFLGSKLESESADDADMFKHLWKLMVGTQIYRRADGSIVPAPTKEKQMLAVLQNEDLFKIWWTNHVGSHPGCTHATGSNHDLAENSDLALVTSRCASRAEDRRLCILSRGGLALVPRYSRQGDRICCVRGSRWPLTVRPENREPTQRPGSGGYKLIGTCLLHPSKFDQDRWTLPPSSKILIA